MSRKLPTLSTDSRTFPFKLLPVGKDYLWGGSRLNDDFNLNLPCDPFAEAWVCSSHPDGVSGIATPHIATEVTVEGKSGESGEPESLLTDVLKANPAYLGTHALTLTGGNPELPILIKLIDAKSDLSIQVHPDDEYAALHENGSLGKTEMWYVLDAKTQSSLVYGFKRDTTSSEIKGSVKNGSVTTLLNIIPVHKNDVYTITPGTVHAIGAGCLIAEIQESSNITYRLYDYDRKDKNGNTRPLHIDKAIDVVNMKSLATPRQPMRTLRYRQGIATELLSRCKYFQVERMLLNTEVERNLVKYQTGANSFHALLVVDGCGNISWDGYSMNFFKGDCIFVPAESVSLKLHGRTQILDVSC